MAFSKARRLANLMSSASDTVPAAKVNTVLADDAVTSPKIADDAVTTDKLANSINTAITANTAKVTNAITTHTGDVTGAAALTIAVDAVDIPMLSASGSPSSTTFLRGDNAWAAPGGVNIASSTPSPTAEGTLHYNTTLDVLYVSNGSAWVPLMNTAPATTGGTVTIPAANGFTSFSYNLGLNFTDDTQSDSELVYTLESGALPGGAVLPTTGNTALTGTATNTGATYNWVIRATDGSAAYSTQAYTQVINAIVIESTGGTITTPSGFRVHTFTSSGTFNPGTRGDGGNVSMALVAGGGAGGGARHGGGGGAGGMIVLTNQTLANGNVTVAIGAGGYNNSYNSWASGSNTVMGSSTAIGGGRAGAYYGAWNLAALAGGSGGGQGYNTPPLAGAAGTSGQGNAGGANSDGSPAYGGGGGGGKSAVGQSGTSNSGGNGGNGLAFEGVTYAGGGGGPGWNGNYGAGGTGGGGTAWTSNYNNSGGQATAGATNTGGGGGGSNSINNQGRGGAGGSGIVIIKVPV